MFHQPAFSSTLVCTPGGTCHIIQPFFKLYYVPPGVQHLNFTRPYFILLVWFQVHDHFENIGTVDCAHLRVVRQGQMCTLTAYDANKEIMPMCFAIFPTETATNWETFTRHIFTLFPSFSLIVSDGSKGLESVSHIFTEFGMHSFPLLLPFACVVLLLIRELTYYITLRPPTEKFHARCAWHILHKNADKNGYKVTDVRDL